MKKILLLSLLLFSNTIHASWIDLESTDRNKGTLNIINGGFIGECKIAGNITSFLLSKTNRPKANDPASFREQSEKLLRLISASGYSLYFHTGHILYPDIHLATPVRIGDEIFMKGRIKVSSNTSGIRVTCAMKHSKKPLPATQSWDAKLKSELDQKWDALMAIPGMAEKVIQKRYEMGYR